MDDAARAIVLYCGVWYRHHLPSARTAAFSLLRFLAHMQDEDGRFGNFILDWTGRRNRAGRIHPDKGAREAIDVARRTGRQLILAGIVQDAEYFRTTVEPFVDGEQIRYVGSVGPAQRDALLGGATALLHLIQFDEPFGLSVVEAMATGTPVIAFRRGSMPELIEDGVSGFLVAPGCVDGAVAAVDRIGDLDRKAARAHVERHFSAERMVDDYLHLYQRLVNPGGQVHLRVMTESHAAPAVACHTQP